MSPAEEGAYIRLLCHMWLDPECSIPDDDETLAKLSRLGEMWLNGSSILVRTKFIEHPKYVHRLTHERLLKEREKQAAWREKTSQAGRKSGQVRRLQRKKQSNGSSVLVQTKSELNTNIISSSSSSNIYTIENEKKPDVIPVSEPVVDVEAIWLLYPWKTKKSPAIEAIRGAVGRHGYEKVLESTRLFASAVQRWGQESMKYIPAPVSFFGEDRFLANPATWEKNATRPAEQKGGTERQQIEMDLELRSLKNSLGI